MKSNRPQLLDNPSTNTSGSKASIKSKHRSPKPLLCPWKCVPLWKMNQVLLLKKKNMKTVRYIEICEDEEVSTLSIVRVLRKLKVFRSLYVGIDQQYGTGDTAGYVWKLYDGLKHLKSISALKSYNCFTPNYWEDKERSLATILRPFPLLQKVLITNDRGDFSDKGARNLSEMLSPLPNLSVISLSLNLTEESAAKGVHDSLIRLKHSFRLVTLKLTLPGNVTMQPLIMVLNRLKLLSTLDLRFLTPVSAEDLQSICLSIQALSLLSTLSLNLNHFRENTEVASISRMLQHLNVLTALELSFRGQKVNNATLIKLYKSIRHFEKMKMFSLHINGFHENGNEALNEFSRALHCMSRLRELNFSFYGFDKATSTGAIKVFQPLQQMTSLTVLKITLDKFIIDEDLHNFGVSLSSLKLLSELQLTFDWSSQKEDRGIKSFFSGLKNCTLLQKIEFVAFSLYIDDEALKIMVESIKHLNLLSYFYIVCHNCKGVTNAGARILSNGFNNLRLLSYFWLVLSHCNNVSKEEIDRLDRKVEKMSVSGRKVAEIRND